MGCFEKPTIPPTQSIQNCNNLLDQNLITEGINCISKINNAFEEEGINTTLEKIEECKKIEYNNKDTSYDLEALCITKVAIAEKNSDLCFEINKDNPNNKIKETSFVSCILDIAIDSKDSQICLKMPTIEASNDCTKVIIKMNQ